MKYMDTTWYCICTLAKPIFLLCVNASTLARFCHSHRTHMYMLTHNAQLQASVETTRNSVLHNATVISHAFMNAGTTVDTFLRDNLEWMGRAANWAKFTATASIGVVHKGHMKESMALLQPYLPTGGVSASPYSEGGALYALGLIHANNGGTGVTTADTAAAGAAADAAAPAVAAGSGGTEATVHSNSEVISYLAKTMRNAGSNETVLHGACLGLGLAAMATGSEVLYEDLKSTLYIDSAVAGEAAAIAIGLLMLGVGNRYAMCYAYM
jgi:26S proteasome regulatory subunit N2